MGSASRATKRARNRSRRRVRGRGRRRRRRRRRRRSRCRGSRSWARGGRERTWSREVACHGGRRRIRGNRRCCRLRSRRYRCGLSRFSGRRGRFFFFSDRRHLVRDVIERSHMALVLALFEPSAASHEATIKAQSFDRFFVHVLNTPVWTDRRQVGAAHISRPTLNSPPPDSVYPDSPIDRASRSHKLTVPDAPDSVRRGISRLAPSHSDNPDRS